MCASCIVCLQKVLHYCGKVVQHVLGMCSVEYNMQEAMLWGTESVGGITNWSHWYLIYLGLLRCLRCAEIRSKYTQAMYIERDSIVVMSVNLLAININLS